MTAILGTIIKDNSPVYIALTKIYGIGIARAKDLCDELGLNYYLKFSELDSNLHITIQKYFEGKYIITSHLRNQIKQNIEKLMRIRCWRGIRHRAGLPTRGQRTQTNARTIKRLSKVTTFKQLLPKQAAKKKVVKAKKK